MSLSRVGGLSVAATSVAIPAHVAGDLIVIWAYRDGNTTPPTVPTATGTVPSFTVIDGPTGANANSAVCAWAIATGTTDTSGTWTNATGISVEVWRGASSTPIGGHAQSGGSVSSGGNVAVPAITLQDPGGGAVVLAFAGWQTVTAWNAAPAGYTQRSQVATECEALSKNTTTTAPAFNVSGTASGAGGTRTQQIELIPDLGNRVSQETVEVVYTTTGAKARVSQEVAEVLYATGAAAARVSQAAVEVLGSYPKNLGNRVSQVAVEVLTRYPKRIVGAAFAGTSSLVATLSRRIAIPSTFAGTSSLTATIARRLGLSPTLAGTSSLSATITVTSGVVKPVAPTFAGTSSLSARVGHPDYITPTIAGTSSLTAQVVQTDYITLELAGTSQLIIGPPGPQEISVDLAGSSSLSAGFGIEVEFDGKSSLSADFKRAQFTVDLHGYGTLTFIGDLGPNGMRLSQIVNEVAYTGDAPTLVLSQVTVEVLRRRSGGHIWQVGRRA